MTLDLQHNKIVKDTVSARFEESLRANLVPMIEDKYGDSVIGIQMYEDYISDNFSEGGAWYYPLTVVTESGPVTEWIKWKLDKNSFKDGVPVFRADLDRSGSFGAIFLKYSDDMTGLKHERGHNSQLMRMGVANYLICIGLPSWQKRSKRPYYQRPWEITADVLVVWMQEPTNKKI